jgi:hypothetical protein
MEEENFKFSNLLSSIPVRNDVPHESPHESPDESPDEEHETKSLRSITIKPLNSGFLVKVGCQDIAIETSDKLIYMLTKYLTNPTKFESEWYSKDVINKLDNIK